MDKNLVNGDCAEELKDKIKMLLELADLTRLRIVVVALQPLDNAGKRFKARLAQIGLIIEHFIVVG